jgi:hypothetical protein
VTDDWGMEIPDAADVEEAEIVTRQIPPTRLGAGIHEIPFDVYLADPCEEPSLRSGDVQRLLTQTPRHFIANHPRLAPKPPRIDSDRMDLGSIVHKLVLGKGDDVRIGDYPDWRKKEAREFRDYARTQGCIPTLTKTFEKADLIAKATVEALEEQFGGWPFGEAEQTFIWQEEVATPDGEPMIVWMRTRPDVVAFSRGLVLDLKTTEVVLTDDAVRRRNSEDDGRVLVQAALQLRGARAMRPDLELTHGHVWVETIPPFVPRVVYANTAHLEQADRRCMRGAERFAVLMQSDKPPAGWPPARLGLAPWQESEWAKQEIAAMGEDL